MTMRKNGIENINRKGETAGNQHLLLSLKCFAFFLIQTLPLEPHSMSSLTLYHTIPNFIDHKGSLLKS